VKQNFLIASARAPIITLLIVAQISLSPGCVTLQRRNLTQEEPIGLTGDSININTASTEDLAKLPGIGETIAERIVVHREQYGPFRRPEHLMMVRGISDQKFRAVRSRIKVD
jgi:competence ComEA-like helix-hairpin-helix protein